MPDSKELQTADSLLDDVQRKIDQFEAMDRQHEREKFAKELLNGDLAGARSEIEKAVVKGYDVSFEKARAYFCEGVINLSVAESPEIQSVFTAVIHNNMMRDAYTKNFVKTWAIPAIAAFLKSAELNPTFQATHYNMGRAYLFIDDKKSATDAFTKAQEGDDNEVAIEAAKAITRMNQKSGPCFVATACYGDFEHPDVLIFRRWRDNYLIPSRIGSMFVSLYYLFSPPFATYVGKMPWLARMIRHRILEPIARRLR